MTDKEQRNPVCAVAHHSGAIEVLCCFTRMVSLQGEPEEECGPFDDVKERGDREVALAGGLQRARQGVRVPQERAGSRSR